jgi:hypothetical protein
MDKLLAMKKHQQGKNRNLEKLGPQRIDESAVSELATHV